MSDAVHLTPEELAGLGILLALRQVEDTESWLDWEDVPNLSEEQFGDLERGMATIGNFMRAELAKSEALLGVDAREILGRVTA